MTRRNAVSLSVAAFVAVAGVVGWIVWVSGLTAAARLRRALDVDTSSTAAIRAGLLEYIPVGTSDDAIARFLTGRGLGTDPDSNLKLEANEVRCEVFPDDRVPDLAYEDYSIHFELDASHRLRDIRVKRGLLKL